MTEKMANDKWKMENGIWKITVDIGSRLRVLEWANATSCFGWISGRQQNLGNRCVPAYTSAVVGHFAIN